MMKMYGGGAMGMPTEETLVLNTKNALIEKLAEKIASDSTSDIAKKLCEQIYMLALVAQRPLEADELSKFISQSSELLSSLD